MGEFLMGRYPKKSPSATYPQTGRSDFKSGRIDLGKGAALFRKRNGPIWKKGRSDFKTDRIVLKNLRDKFGK